MAASINLDSGALSALAAQDEPVREFIARAIAQKAQIVVPAVVVAESTTGTARDAAANRVLAAFSEIAGVTERRAREAGALRFAAQRPRGDTVDALVVAEADSRLAAVVLTSDPEDLRALAAVRGRTRVVSIV